MTRQSQLSSGCASDTVSKARIPEILRKHRGNLEKRRSEQGMVGVKNQADIGAVYGVKRA